jgi:hypothetical protein
MSTMSRSNAYAADNAGIAGYLLPLLPVFQLVLVY